MSLEQAIMELTETVKLNTLELQKKTLFSEPSKAAPQINMLPIDEKAEKAGLIEKLTALGVECSNRQAYKTLKNLLDAHIAAAANVEKFQGIEANTQPVQVVEQIKMPAPLEPTPVAAAASVAIAPEVLTPTPAAPAPAPAAPLDRGTLEDLARPKIQQYAITNGSDKAFELMKSLGAPTAQLQELTVEKLQELVNLK